MALPSVPARRSSSGVPLARSVIRAGLGRAFGPPPFDPSEHPGDPGLFGPDSASWRIIAEPAAIVGGVRALLLQMLHPLAVAGVADHSRYREDSLGRLRRTSAYVTTTTFGSLPQALEAARRVGAVHHRVQGTSPEGVPYRAGDARLLTWVSICLTASFLATDRAYAPRPVPAGIADAFVAEQARAAALLDPRVDLDEIAGNPRLLHDGRLPLLEEGILPVTVDQLEACLRSFDEELAVGEQGRGTFRFLLWPDVPAAMLAGYLPLLTGAVATLDRWERVMLGLPGSRLLVYPALAQCRALLAVVRLASGTSPTRDAAIRRAGVLVDAA